MDSLFWLNVFSRWLHVTSAVVFVGALIFARLVLEPALAAQEPSAREAMMRQVLPRFKSLLHASIGLLLVTGAYNLYAAIPQVKTLSHRSLYDSLIGAKVLLALVLFAFVTALVSSSSAFAKIQEMRRQWLTLLIVMSLAILLLAAILRRLWNLH